MFYFLIFDQLNGAYVFVRLLVVDLLIVYTPIPYFSNQVIELFIFPIKFHIPIAEKRKAVEEEMSRLELENNQNPQRQNTPMGALFIFARTGERSENCDTTVRFVYLYTHAKIKNYGFCIEFFNEKGLSHMF